MKKILLMFCIMFLTIQVKGQTQTQDINMGLYQLKFNSANGGSNRIQSFGGTYPGAWLFKSRFDNIIIDAGENENNRYQILFKSGNVESARIKSNGYFGIGTATPSGRLHVKGETYVDGGWLRVLGQKGLYFQNHGGGLYMTDNTWIRTYGNKNFYHNTGVMRTDGTFQVGSGGSRFSVRTDGKVGIGITAPTQKLDVNGTILSRGGLQINGTDFQLGLNNSRSKGTKTAQRALVHSTLDRLFVNYGGDFEGGVQINGPKTIIDGNVGIGTTNPDSKLSVNGKIHAREVKVDLIGWSDFVFEKEYNLPTLKQVENHIKEKGHLQDIPSAKEVAKNGIFLGEMNAKLLQKIEELTLYTIDQEKRLKAQNAKNSDLESRLARLEELLKTSKEK